MEKTWRWFGRKDKITLPMLRIYALGGLVTGTGYLGTLIFGIIKRDAL